MPCHISKRLIYIQKSTKITKTFYENHRLNMFHKLFRVYILRCWNFDTMIFKITLTIFHIHTTPFKIVFIIVIFFMNYTWRFSSWCHDSTIFLVFMLHSTIESYHYSRTDDSHRYWENYFAFTIFEEQII